MVETVTRSNAIIRADEVIGVQVINTAHEDLGTINTVCLDKLTGQVTYLVLESGSFLGIGGKLFAIPWSSIHYNTDEEAFLLDVSKERLKNAPGFDKDHWPNMADPTFSKTLFEYYGTKK